MTVACVLAKSRQGKNERGADESGTTNIGRSIEAFDYSRSMSTSQKNAIRARFRAGIDHSTVRLLNFMLDEIMR